MNMIIATHNAHKIEEFGRILAPLGITVQTAEADRGGRDRHHVP